MSVRMAALALIAVAGTAALTACDSGGKQVKGQAFRQCMSEHGITLPQPEKGNAGTVRMNTPPPGVDQQAFQAARDACAGK